MTLADIMRVADHDNVVAVKFATTNVMLLSECIRASNERTAIWVCGLAESWALPFYSIGARGFTSGLVNIDPVRSLAIHAALEAGDFAKARDLVATIATFEKLRTKFGNGSNVTVVKAGLEAIGYPVGPVRVPGLAALDEADTRLVAEIVASWGVTPRQVGRTAA
jgi:4-hydroxy-tetrahydrodipicolinate synthase